jgi:hypothetical protein
MIAAKMPPLDPNKLPIGINDPILRELYEVKAAMNAEAGYSVEAIYERARNLDVAALVAQVNAAALAQKLQNQGRFRAG